MLLNSMQFNLCDVKDLWPQNAYKLTIVFMNYQIPILFYCKHLQKSYSLNKHSFLIKLDLSKCKIPNKYFVCFLFA